MKFAVTGASGFVASNFLEFLNKNCFDNVGLSRVLPSASSSSSARTIPVDYQNPVSLESALAGVDVVVHLAGMAHKKLPSYNSKTLLYDANVDCLKRICLASLNQGVHKIIYVSSIGVLGSCTNGLPLNDFSILKPHNQYCESKLEAELFLTTYAPLHSIDYVILRPPLVYGRNCPGNLAKLINFIKFSPIIPFDHLVNRRSYISVDNLVEAIFVSAFSSAASNGSYVLSDGVDLPLRSVILALFEGLGKPNSRLVGCDPDLLAWFCKLLGKKSIFDQLSSELLVDSSRFQRIANWVPPVHTLDGLRLAAASFV